MAIAQSFEISRLDDGGMFVTSVDLFFQTKSNTDPIIVEIRPMSGVHPDSFTALGSVVKNASDVNADINGNTTTRFTFEEPIYLKHRSKNAIVIKTNSEEYKLLIAEIDAPVRESNSSARIRKQAYTGTFFTSANGNTWTAEQNKDLTFRLLRARFTQATGTLSLKTGDLPLKAVRNNAIEIISSTPTSPNHEVVVKVNDNSHGFSLRDNVSISGALAVGNVSANNINGTHEITSVDTSGYAFKVSSSTPAIVESQGGGNAIMTTQNIKFDIFNPSIQTLNPTETSITPTATLTRAKSLAGNEQHYTPHLPQDIAIYDDNVLSAPALIANSDIESSQLASRRSAELTIQMDTTSNYVSPVIDLEGASLTLVNNIIDKQVEANPVEGESNVPIKYVSEENSNGSAGAKHLTIPINLVDPASAIKILIDANRPAEADFSVYVRINDSQDWNEVAPETPQPTDENPGIFRTYEYIWGDDPNELADDLTFTDFQVKVVFKSTNSSKVPTIKSLRAIALIA